MRQITGNKFMDFLLLLFKDLRIQKNKPTFMKEKLKPF